MPRYVVECTLPEGWEIGAERSVERYPDDGVTWVQSYVSDDGLRAFCVYDAAGPEAIRRVAQSSGLPIDRITHVLVLSPHSYR
jgi:uncharacterized protein DUF4242